VFFLVPPAAASLLSSTDFDVYAVADLRRLRVVGGANYSRLLEDPRFWTALRNTVWVVLVARPVAVVWRYLHPPRYGLLTQLLGAVGIAPIDWLGDPAWALPALALLAVWKNFGFNMLVFLAGLQAIPARLSQGGRLDA